MPTKNVTKVFVPNAFYHVYNRGWNLGNIFIDKKDYQYFEHLIARHISTNAINVAVHCLNQHTKQYGLKTICSSCTSQGTST